MSSFTESIIEETALEWLKDMGCQRIAFGETDKRMKSHNGTMTDSWALACLRGGMSLPRVMRGDVRVKDVEDR